MLGRGYLWLRQRVRGVVTRSPALDRYLGDVLRALERRTKLVQMALRDQAGGSSVTVRGLVLHHRPEDLGVVGALRMHDDYEPTTRQLVERVLKPGMRVVDLGAHIGFFSLIAAQKVRPTGAVYAFEPADDTADLLQRNIAENQLTEVVTVVRSAISDRPRELRFAIHPDSSVSNKMAEAADDDCTIVTVAATSLDAYFEPLGYPPIDLIKMDVEGAELDAMRGMAEVSRHSPNLKLIFELHHENLRRLDIGADQLFEQLAALGFDSFSSLHRRLEPVAIPEDLPALVELSQRANLNILCEKRGS